MRSRGLGFPLLRVLLLTVATVGTAAALEPARFVGDSRCGNPTCHGAGLPATDADKANWKPWRSARSQWLNRDLDRHSRAYATLETDAAKTIARYMAIDATTSDKCLACHAPAATAVPRSTYQRSDGVTCEHCHGAAEYWLEAHVQKDWATARASFAARGFYDNRDPTRRADKCASCHLDLDHEIVAGGHPPLQFEMVAYGAIVKHWEERDAGDATLWAVGQIVGLRRSLQMVARRAGESDYQGLGKFSHFEGKNCYQCHHKLVEDGLRQAQGHYEMTSSLFSVLFPDRRSELAAAWTRLSAATADSATQTEKRATELAQWLEPYPQRVTERKASADDARQVLATITAGGPRLKEIRRFAHRRPATANTTEIDNIGVPWWYTTGAPEQSILAIEALCEPVFPGRCGMSAEGIGTELRQLLAATDRFAYDPSAYASALAALHRKLFP